MAKRGETKYVNVDGSDVAYQVVGKGALDLVYSEIMASSTVKDLVIGSDTRFDDRGAHELKGVPGEWRLYAVAQS